MQDPPRPAVAPDIPSVLPLYKNNPTIGQMPLSANLPSKASAKRPLQDMSYLIPPVLPLAYSQTAKGADTKPPVPAPAPAPAPAPVKASQPMLLPKPPAMSSTMSSTMPSNMPSNMPSGMPSSIPSGIPSGMASTMAEEVEGEKAVKVGRGASQQSTPKQTGGVPRSLIQSVGFSQPGQPGKPGKPAPTPQTQPQHAPAYLQVPPFKRSTPKTGAQPLFPPKQQPAASKRGQSLPAGNEVSRQMPLPMVENYPGMGPACDYNGMMPNMPNMPNMPVMGSGFGQTSMMRPRPVGMVQGFGAMGNQPNTPHMTGIPPMPGVSNVPTMPGMPGVGMEGQSVPMNYGYPSGYPNGMMNGFPGGYPNGMMNGYPNGYPNGMMNGFANGMMNGAAYYPPMQPMMGDGKMSGGNAGKMRMTPMQQPQQGMMQPYFVPGMSGEMDGSMMPGTQ